MKKCYTFFVVLLIAAIPLLPDGYLKVVERTGAFYNFGTLTPASEQVVEYWFSKNQAAMVRTGRLVSVDLEKKRLIFANRAGKTYMETPLPLDPDSYAVERLANALKNFNISGSVKETGETKKIGNWNCKAYKVLEWQEFRGARTNEKEITIWVSGDMGVDMEAFGRVFFQIRKYSGLGGKYQEELKKMPGIEVLAQITRYVRGSKAESSRRLVEFSQKDPPPGIYGIPEGFKKKEKIGFEDFGN